MRILNQQNFKNQRAIVRVDFNVPLNEKFEVTDRTRIEAAKSTIDYILNKGGSCVLLSHLGRPDGRDPKLSLSHIVKTVAEVLDRPVKFCSTSVGTEAEAASNGLDQGEVLLMENLRFHKEETSGDVIFSEKLARLGTIYVNDAFGTAHRAHASTTIIARFFGKNKCLPTPYNLYLIPYT